MNKDYVWHSVLDKLRDISGLPGFSQAKYLFRQLQAQTRPQELKQMRQLVATLPLAPVLAQQPRFLYKYLSSYTASNFSRPMRLAAIQHHYQFMARAVQADFFSLLAHQPIVWQQGQGDEQFTISLSYPLKASFEGELSLNFYCGNKLVQMITCVVVPGSMVGVSAQHILLVSQVQGTLQPEAIRAATKQLHDITPASLLINAAYGLATALGIIYGVGISSQHQLGRGTKCHFDYDTFWQQFRGELLASNFYLLDIQHPEKPIEEVKPKYRQRSLRKRAYKQQVRQAVAAAFQTHFMPQPGPANERLDCLAGSALPPLTAYQNG